MKYVLIIWFIGVGKPPETVGIYNSLEDCDAARLAWTSLYPKNYRGACIPAPNAQEGASK